MVDLHGDLISGGDLPLGTVYHKGRRALFTTNLVSSEVPRASEVVLQEIRSNGIEPWFDSDNAFPQKVLADIESSDIIPQVIEWKATTLVGEGVAYGNMVEGPGGSLVLKPMQIPEIERWMHATAFDLFLYEAALEFYRFYNANVELQRNLGGEVVGCWSQDQSFLRLSANDEQGRIRRAYFSSEWDVSTGPKSKGVLSMEALDPYYDLVRQIEQSKEHRHIIPIRTQGAGRKHYALAPWNGLRSTGWLQLSLAIAKMKLRLIEQLMQMRFWIEIADEYWPLKFGHQKWKDATPQQKQAMVNKEVADFEELMGGEDEVGIPKAIMTRMLMMGKQEMTSLWKIHEMQLKTPDGAYVEDSREADFHLIRGLGVDPMLYGITPSKTGSSSGSGSADRVKRTNYVLSCRPHGTALLRHMHAVGEINGWHRDFNKGKPLTWMLRSLHTATQDQNNAAMPEAGIMKPEENGTV